MPVTKYIWDVTTDSYLMATDENDATTAVYTNGPGLFLLIADPAQEA